MYGIGEFGFQSYMIFCRDAAQTLWPADRALQSFVRWARGVGGGESLARSSSAAPSSGRTGPSIGLRVTWPGVEWVG